MTCVVCSNQQASPQKKKSSTLKSTKKSDKKSDQSPSDETTDDSDRYCEDGDAKKVGNDLKRFMFIPY